MVSKAREDLPEPERPVITVNELRGISRLMFFRLCWRAPRIVIFVSPILGAKAFPAGCSAAPQAFAPHSGHNTARITLYNASNLSSSGQDAPMARRKRGAGKPSSASLPRAMHAPPSPDNPPSAELSGRAFIGWLAAILGVAGASYALVAAAHPVFGRAEIYFAESARAMLASHSYVTPHYLGQPFFDKPILSYWAIVASFETLGLTHFAARLPSLVAALATAALTGYGAALLAGRRAGLAAAGVLCSTYMFGYFSTLSLSDMWLTLFTSAACVLLLAGSLDARRRTLHWWLASVCLALAFLSKGPVGVILPVGSFLLYLALAREWRQLRLRHVLTAFATIGAVAGVWFFALWRENGTQSLYAFFIEENLLRFRGETYRTDRYFGYIPISFVIGGLPWTLLLPAVAWRSALERRDLRASSEVRA